jgi:NAD(P)-dependent dehydrogenase (short-subunit alcohol dehydrogenase family)
MQIKSSVFLVTGGASGLGAACAERFGARGARVLIADLNADAGERLAARIVRFLESPPPG